MKYQNNRIIIDDLKDRTENSYSNTYECKKNKALNELKIVESLITRNSHEIYKKSFADKIQLKLAIKEWRVAMLLADKLPNKDQIKYNLLIKYN
jgi:hypothetical protein